MTTFQEAIDTAAAELASIRKKIRTGDFLPLGLDWRDRTAASESLRDYEADLSYWIAAMKRAARRDDPEAFEEVHAHFIESVGDVYQYAVGLESWVRFGV